MFDHIQLKVKDLKASKRFYTAGLAPLGFTVQYEGDGVTRGWRDVGLRLEGVLVRELALSFDEMFALAVRAFGVLLLGRGYAHHAAHVPIAAQPGGQHAQHSLRVKPVRLGPACAAVDQDAGGLEHVSSNAVCRQ